MSQPRRYIGKGAANLERLLRPNRLAPVHPQHSVTRRCSPDCRVGSNAWSKMLSKMGQVAQRRRGDSRRVNGAILESSTLISNDAVVGIAAVAIWRAVRRKAGTFPQQT